MRHDSLGSRIKFRYAFVGNAVGYARHEGFSVVELVVSVAIVGILASVAVPNYQIAADRAALRATEGAMISTETYVKLFFLENNSYPSSGGLWVVPQLNSALYTPCTTFAPETQGVCEFMPQINSRPNDICRGTDWEVGSVLYISDGLDYKVLVHCHSSPEANLSSRFSDPPRSGWGISKSSRPAIQAAW